MTDSRLSASTKPAGRTRKASETPVHGRFRPRDLLVALLLVTVLGGICWLDRLGAVAPPPRHDSASPAKHQTHQALSAAPTIEPEGTPESKPMEDPSPPQGSPAQTSPPPVDPVYRVALQFSPDGRFGLQTTSGNPDDLDDDFKLLTSSPDGATNNVRIWVDGETPLYGSAEGHFVLPNRETAAGRYESTWEYRGIAVTQIVEVVPGEMSQRMDCVRVTYRLKNSGSRQRSVGLRVMLHTPLRGNDDVPFVVPGSPNVVTSPVSYMSDKVPDFVCALERTDLVNPGVVLDIGLQPSAGDRPSEVILTSWPGSLAEWDYDRSPPLGNDPAVGIYYEARTLAPGETRSMDFTYGLGTLSSMTTRNSRLSLTASGPFRAGGKFRLVALVQDPKAGQEVRLILPKGLSLSVGEEPSKPVSVGASYTQVSWWVQVAPKTLGARELTARLESDGIAEQQVIHVTSAADGKSEGRQVELKRGTLTP